MKRFYFSKLILPIAILMGCNMGANAQSIAYTYTASCTFQTYTVTPGTFSVVVDMSGAKGATDYFNVNQGGNGGRVQCTIATTPGQVLYMLVGGTGSANNGSSTAVAGGCNGGGPGNTGSYYAGSGGGASDIRIGGTGLNNRVVVAGGGGGAGYNGCCAAGGLGGGTTGGNGTGVFGSGPGYGGRGGTPSASGAGGTYCYCPAGSAGIANVGGLGGGYGGGSGGGGYFGGGGGSYYASGGGGSSYTDPVLATAVTHTQGYNASPNGSITITPICTPPLTTTSVTGTTNVCGAGVNVPFSNPGGSPGGVWTSSNAGVATVSNTGVVTSVGAGTTTISYSVVYGCGNNGYPNLTLTVNPIPAVISPASPSVCVGSTVTLSDVTGSGTWTSSNPFICSIAPGSGGTGIASGLSAGVATITYTVPTGCYSTTNITVLPSPAPIAGTARVCAGATTALSDATPSGTWFSANTAVATINSSGLVFGTLVGGGSSATISYTLGNGCYAVLPVAVNALPTAATVSASGTGHYCASGSGVHILLSSSSLGVNYQLYNGSTPVGTPIAGTAGGALDYGLLTAAGTYTVLATNATSGCSNNMTGSGTISIDPLPAVGLLSVTGGGAYCAGGSGQDISINPTQTGILYQLYITTSTGTVTIGPTILGNGTLLPMGTYYGAGTYTAIGFNTSTGCSSSMTGSPAISINPAPVAYNVTGGGDYCPYGTGKHIGLDNSVSGISYQLFFGSTPGPTVAGSGASLDFGSLTAQGTYTVSATNTTTGCSADMNGTATIVIDPLPSVYPVGGGGPYCAGGTGADVNMSPSDFNVNYQLYVGGVAIGAPAPGNGGLLDFNLQTTAGNYTVIGTDGTTGCYNAMGGSATVSISPLPTIYPLAAMGGATSYCATGSGIDLVLGGSDPGISYELFVTTSAGTSSTSIIMPGTGGSIDFGSQTVAGAYSAVATNTVTMCQSNMAGRPSISINPLPDQNNVTVSDGGIYCAGGIGVHVGLDFSNIGVSYQLYNGSTAVGTPTIGSSSGLDFGLQTAAGTYTVKATNTTTGCMSSMLGSANVIINPLPTTYLVTSASSSYCVGGAGVDIQLTSSDMMINYQLYNAGIPVGAQMPGSGSALDFGMQTLTGAYTVVATDAASACVANMMGAPSIAINPLPTVYSVTGGGVYCDGSAGLHVGLAGSARGTSYQLFNGFTPTGSIVSGTGAAIDFGYQTAAGNYSIVATNTTTTCANEMGGSVSIVVNPAPVAFAVTGGGAYCAGGTGYHIGMGNSASGMTYQLYNGSSAVGASIPGSTGSAVDFGLQTAAGTYMVKATDIATGCMANMTGTPAISVNPLPVAFTVYGGGSYCTGGAGLPVHLSGSATGVNYQLYHGSSAVGGPMPGTGLVLDFGIMSGSGSYMVVATDAATTCAANMASSAVVTVNPLPVAYTVSGGGSYCAGGSGVNISLSLSDFGISYQLYNGSTPVGSPVGGAGMTLNFGLQTAAGTYHVVATDPVTTCNNNMISSTTVNITPTVTPGVTISGPGTTVCAGSSATLSAIPVNGGAVPAYQWYVNGTIAGVGDTYSYMPANGDIVTAIMTSTADCPSPAFATGSSTMSVLPNMTPSVNIVTSPGTTVCQGTSVTLTPTPVSGGTAPQYVWLKNGAPVSTSGTYTYVPANADVVELLMASNYVCRSMDTVFSNTQLMNVNNPLVPVVNITANPGNNVAPGQTVTLTANITNAGTSPEIQWYKNNVAIAGANGTTLTSSSFVDQDVVTCNVTSSGACGGMQSFNSITFYVRNTGVGAVTSAGAEFAVMPNPSNGSFVVKGHLAGGADEEVTLELTNMLGQVVYRNTVMTQNGNVNEQVKLVSAANGMYILNVHSASEQAVYHVVIEQ